MRKFFRNTLRVGIGCLAVFGAFMITSFVIYAFTHPRTATSDPQPTASLAILAPTVTSTIAPFTTTPLPPTTTATAAPTDTPSPTSTPALVLVTTNNAANIRSGPGAEFSVVGNVQAGSQLTIQARTDAGDWYLIQDGTWIAAFLIDTIPSVPTVPPTPTATPTSTPRPLAKVDYGTFLKSWIARATDTFSRLVELANTPGADLTGLADEMIAIEAELHTVSPPSDFTNFHKLLITSMTSCRDAAINYRDRDNAMGNINIDLCQIGMELAADKLRMEH